jgi:S1-C subfamily serine protease
MKWLSIGLIVMVLGGVGGVAIDRIILPKWVAHLEWRQLAFLRHLTENTTVINNTQQVVIREDDSVEKISAQAANTVVNIISIQANAKTDSKSRPNTTTLAPAPTTLTGSGILLTNDGLIVTYRTAILEQANRYRVSLSNGASYPATLASIDPLTNLAFFRVDATGLPAIAFANSDDMRPGKKLIMLANSAEEYQNRFSQTLLSDINKNFNLSEKTVASSEKWEGIFDVDMAHPESYLGGPAINYNGELVGIMGSVRLDNQTTHFLLPGNVIKQAFTRILNEGFTTRPTLGVYYETITKAYALSHDLTRDRGALVFAPLVNGRPGAAVIEGSPAAAAGLRYGDIIIAVDGQEINLDHPLSTLIGQSHTGASVQLLIIRNGNEQTVTVQL